MTRGSATSAPTPALTTLVTWGVRPSAVPRVRRPRLVALAGGAPPIGLERDPHDPSARSTRDDAPSSSHRRRRRPREQLAAAVFWSPQPGVIVYQYRRGKLVPVPVLEPEPARERRWKFELRPMTPQERAAVATVTVGGMLLLIAMILLAPVGA